MLGCKIMTKQGLGIIIYIENDECMIKLLDSSASTPNRFLSLKKSDIIASRSEMNIPKLIDKKIGSC